jgi:pimeloyl-ACP methyl ester carboxylesterase
MRAMKTLLKLLGALLVLLAAAIGGFAALNWAPDRPVSELAARWAPPPSMFVDVAGMQVHLRDEGPREDPVPLVLLHGTSASLHTWEGWTQALKDQRRVIRFDMPGFGLTGPNPSGDYTIDAYVAFTVAMLDKLGVKRCVLGGNSFGGYVAWTTALLHPERVDRLILVDAGGYPYQSQSVPIGFRIARIPVLNRLVRNILPRKVIVDSVTNVYGDPGKVTPDLVDRYFDLTTREGNRHALAERFRQAKNGAYSERVKEIKAPALILWGAKDRLIPGEVGERFHRDIAGSELIVLDGLGHVPQEEDTARTVAAVKKFLSL